MRSTLAVPQRLWDRAFGWKRRNEAAATLKHAKPWLKPGATVLDIGCGMGYALEVLDDDYDIVSFGCDVVPSIHRIKRFVRFDGSNLPFADKSIDVAMLIFVLHHAEDAAELLREAARVATSAVLVVEDTPRTMLDRHATQRLTLAPFTLAVERFRAAPAYDFRQLPNGGRLFYETMPLGLDGGEWLDLARAALDELGLGDT